MGEGISGLKLLDLPGSRSFFGSIAGAQAVMNGKAKTASGIKALNKYTIRFTLSHPDVTFLNVMAMNFAYIVPKEVVKKEGAQFGHKPVGTGPFTLQQWVAGQKLVFKRNPHYFLKGVPKLAGITFLIGLDPNVALLRVQRGQLDLTGDPIPGPDFLQIKNDPKNKNKPENILTMIIEGKMKTWYAENVLVEQPFVKDDSKTVGQLLAQHGLKLVKFVRYKVGEVS